MIVDSSFPGSGSARIARSSACFQDLYAKCQGTGRGATFYPSPGVMPKEEAISSSTWELVQMMALLEAGIGVKHGETWNKNATSSKGHRY